MGRNPTSTGKDGLLARHARLLIPILSILATIGIIVNATSNRPGALPQMERRAGVRMTRIAEVKDSSRPVRLIPFEYSMQDAYVLELGDRYIRFYHNRAQVQSAGKPYEIASPWDANDVFELQYDQDDEDAQTMRFKHPDYPPYKLTRNSASHTDWTLSEDDSHEK